MDMPLAPRLRPGQAQALEIVPTGAALGADIRGVDLRSIDESVFAAIYEAWLDHAVVLFRNQHLADEDLIAFSRRFGTLDPAPIQHHAPRIVEARPRLS